MLLYKCNVLFLNAHFNIINILLYIWFLMCNESRAEQSDWPINSQTMIDLTIEMISLIIYAGETQIFCIHTL